MSPISLPARSRRLWQLLKARPLIIALIALAVGALSSFFMLDQKAEPSKSQDSSNSTSALGENVQPSSLIHADVPENTAPAANEMIAQGRKEPLDHKDSEIQAPASLEDFLDLLRQDRLDFGAAMSYLAEYEDSLNLVELRGTLEAMANTSTQKSILLLLMVKTGAIDDALRFAEADSFLSETGNYLVLSVYGDALLQTSRYQESLQIYQRAFDMLQKSQEEDRSVKLQLLKQNIDRAKARLSN